MVPHGKNACHRRFQCSHPRAYTTQLDLGIVGPLGKDGPRRPSDTRLPGGASAIAGKAKHTYAVRAFGSSAVGFAGGDLALAIPPLPPTGV